MISCNKGEISIHGDFALIATELMTLCMSIRDMSLKSDPECQPFLTFMGSEAFNALTGDTDENLKRMKDDAEFMKGMLKLIEQLGNKEEKEEEESE